MTIEQSLYTALSGDGDVSGLVGTRIYPGEADENPTTPYIVYITVFGTHAATFSGRSLLKNSRIQVDCYADTFSEVRTLADHVYDAVDTNMSAGDLREVYFYEDLPKLHRIALDFSLWE